MNTRFKILKDLYPKYLLLQCMIIVLIIFYLKFITTLIFQYQWLHYDDYFFGVIIIVAIISCICFVPKIKLIIFKKPNKGQRTTREALFAMLVLCLVFPNFFLREITANYLGKLVIVDEWKQIQDHPSATFFVVKNGHSLEHYHNNYYVHQYNTGRSKLFLHYNIYATKFNKLGKDNNVVFASIYKNDFENTVADQKLHDKLLKEVHNTFAVSQILPSDTLMRISNKSTIDLLHKSLALSIKDDRSASQVLLFVEKINSNENYNPQKILWLYLIIFVCSNAVVILFLSTAISYKNKQS